MGRFPFRTSKLWNNSEDQAMTTLADIAARRGFRRLVHIHCDHFEPEVAIQKGVYHPDKLAAYLRNMYPFRPSLFFMPSFCVMLRDDADSEIVAQRSDDPVVFTDFSRGSQVSESLKVAKADGRCDIHGHMHHELWTKNECTGAKLVPRPQTHLDAKQHRLRDWVQNDSTAAADSARFSLALELYLDWFATHIGDMTDWCFVHGCWALQASDPTICTITDEIKDYPIKVAEVIFPVRQDVANVTPPVCIHTRFSLLLGSEPMTSGERSPEVCMNIVSRQDGFSSGIQDANTGGRVWTTRPVTSKKPCHCHMSWHFWSMMLQLSETLWC